MSPKMGPICKKRRPKRTVLCWHYLSSRAVTRKVLSAQMSLTSVFGMGTGGPSSQSIPTRMDGFEAIFYVKSLPAFNAWIIAPFPVPVNSFFRSLSDFRSPQRAYQRSVCQLKGGETVPSQIEAQHSGFQFRFSTTSKPA